jgi:hypothetical protein
METMGIEVMETDITAGINRIPEIMEMEITIHTINRKDKKYSKVKVVIKSNP